MGRGITSPHDAESNAIPFRCKMKIITARYRGDLLTKDGMNMLQKKDHIKRKKKRNMRTRKREEKSLPL
jgi:hypothetical protein